ncbi:MAG TPA: hypothetical protein VEX13_13640 [Chloroflexia bacterium]|nr:hypothetical protein [Chloroflexia bacterium]
MSDNGKDTVKPYRLSVSNSDTTLPRTLDEARQSKDNFVILEGSQQGQIYLTCQAVLVVCWEPVLKLLLRDLDAIAFPHRGSQARVRYERLPAGLAATGLAEQSQEASGLWIHEHFTALGLDVPIRAILKGRLGRISLGERLRHTALKRAKYGAQLARERVLG